MGRVYVLKTLCPIQKDLDPNRAPAETKGPYAMRILVIHGMAQFLVELAPICPYQHPPCVPLL